MAYTVVNDQVFGMAFAGARAGMLSSKRLLASATPADYSAITVSASLWAEEFDTQWASATVADGLQIGLIYQDSKGVWEERLPGSLSAAQAAAQVSFIIAAIAEAETLFSMNGWPIPTWGTGGGGGGGVPAVPATSLGWALRSTGGPGPAATNSAWGPDGGPAILTFTKTNGSLFELGNSDVNPVFAATYNEAATAGQINYTGAAGSPLVLVAPYTAGTIAHTFTSTVNGTVDTFTLAATVGGSPLTRGLSDTWASPLLFDITATGTIAATQGFLDTMRADHGVSLHTVMGGTYGTGLTVGAGEQFSFAAPTAFPLASVTDPSGFPIAPVTAGTVAGYTNPFGVVIPMTLYTFGGVAIGVLTPKGFTVS